MKKPAETKYIPGQAAHLLLLKASSELDQAEKCKDHHQLRKSINLTNLTVLILTIVAISLLGFIIIMQLCIWITIIQRS